MKADDFADFFTTGKYGSGGKVMVQLKDIGTLTAVVNERKELEVMTVTQPNRELALRLMQELGRDLTPDELAQVPKVTGVVPPVPVLIGEVDKVNDDMLLVTYNGAGGKRFRVSVNVDDVKHITSAENAHIHL